MGTHEVVRVGIIGLGLMGEPMARHLAEAGFHLECLDLDEEAMKRAVEVGASAAGTVSDLAASSEVIFVVLPTAADVAGVCRGPSGIFENAKSSTVVLLCSSLRPEICQELATEGYARGISVVDAPMTGGIRAAQSGTMTLLLGGDATAIERARLPMTAVASTIRHLGPVGNGQIGKTVNNTIHWGQIAVITEALALGAKLGANVATLREALYEANVDSKTLRELEKMRFTWYGKDLEDALGLAETVGHEMPAAKMAQTVMPTISPSRVAQLLERGVWDIGA